MIESCSKCVALTPASIKLEAIEGHDLHCAYHIIEVECHCCEVFAIVSMGYLSFTDNTLGRRLVLVAQNLGAVSRYGGR